MDRSDPAITDARASARAWLAASEPLCTLAVGVTPRLPPQRFAAAIAALVRAEIHAGLRSATATVCCSRKRRGGAFNLGANRRTGRRRQPRAAVTRSERVKRSTLLATSGARCSRGGARSVISASRREAARLRKVRKVRKVYSLIF